MDIHLGYEFLTRLVSLVFLGIGLVGWSKQRGQKNKVFKKIIFCSATFLGISLLFLTPFLFESSWPIIIKIIILLIPPVTTGGIYYIFSTPNYEKHLGIANSLIGIIAGLLVLSGAAVQYHYPSHNSDSPQSSGGTGSSTTSTNVLPEDNSCDDNAFIYCGFSTAKELADKISSGDGKHTDIKSTLGSIGIYSEDIISSRAEEGYIKTDGTVWLNGNKIADNVVIGQRQQVQNCTQWAGLFWCRPSSFNLVGSARALIYTKDGDFLYALVNTSGSPVFKDSLSSAHPNLNVSLLVNNNGRDSEWHYTESAKPGDVVAYLITIKNISDVSAEEASVRSKLPEQMELVPNSFKSRYVRGEEDYEDHSGADSGVEGGLGMGVIWPDQTAYVQFSLKIKDDILIDNCTNIPVATLIEALYVKGITTTIDIKVCPY